LQKDDVHSWQSQNPSPPQLYQCSPAILSSAHELTNPNGNDAIVVNRFTSAKAERRHTHPPKHDHGIKLNASLRGFAYALDRKTVVRACFGLFYSHAGGTGGRANANSGTGQLGFTGGESPASANGGITPAFYLNNAAGFAYSNSAGISGSACQ